MWTPLAILVYKKIRHGQYYSFFSKTIPLSSIADVMKGAPSTLKWQSAMVASPIEFSYQAKATGRWYWNNSGWSPVPIFNDFHKIHLLLICIDWLIPKIIKNQFSPLGNTPREFLRYASIAILAIWFVPVIFCAIWSKVLWPWRICPVP